jgi:hypothetical protein
MLRRNGMSRKPWFIGGVVAAALLFAAGAGVVLAQSGDEGGNSFLERVAQKLGVAPEDLEQAVRDVRNEDVDAAVQRGDLTEEEGQELKERLDNAPAFPERRWAFPGPRFPHEFKRDEGAPGPFPRGPRFDHKGPFGFGFGFGIPEAVDDLAVFLGIEREQLLEELMQDDASLASVAESHGKSRDELKAFISAEAGERLEAAVEEGLLSEERAAEVKTRIDEALDSIIDMQFGFPWKEHFRFDFRFDGGDDHDAPDETTPEPQGGASEQIPQS